MKPKVHELNKIRSMIVSKKMLLLILVFSISNGVVSQNLNGYKYAYIPSKFTFFKEANKYNLNSLSKLFMEKYGFETYLDSDTAPFDFVNTNCNKVYVHVLKDNSLFLTKLKVVLKDCNGNVLFTSKEGSSKEKELKVAYNQALRQAFASLESLHHKYDPNVIAYKQVQNPAIKETTSQPKEVTQQKEEKKVEKTGPSSEPLYAQPIQNGFQLVNEEPKVVMKLYKTSVKDLYTAVKENVQGVLVSKNGEWFFEYYQNDKLISEKVNVKF